MRNVIAFLVLWACLLLDSTVFQIPPLNIIQPNLILVALITIALSRGSKTALLLGVIVGFLQDANYGPFLGLNAFIYGVIGYFAAAAFAQFLHRNVAITFFVTVVCTFLHVWISFGLTRLFDVTAYSWSSVLAQSLWQMIVNGMMLLLLYPLFMKWFSSRPRSRYSGTETDAV